MTYVFDFAWLLQYWPVLLKGLAVTIELTVVGGTLGILLGIVCAWARALGPAWARPAVAAYVELIRNTPFLIQLFFIFFGLPSLGLQMSEMTAAYIAMVINLGAYGAEIVRAGIQATPRGQFEAGASLGMAPLQTFRHVVLVPALQRIWPALSSQVIIVMLGSAVVSQIAAEDLTFAANFIQSRTFRAFEAYAVSTVIYLLLAILLRQALAAVGRAIFPAEGGAVIEFSTWDILRNLLLAARWTILLSLVSFVGGGIVGAALLFLRTGGGRLAQRFVTCYVELFQGTPLLMQLFLAFFGLGLFGIAVPAWAAAALALVLWTAAFLTEIWRGCVESIAKGQWEASSSLGMGYVQQMRHVILPQAVRIAIPPTVGFSVQVVKGTALTSIIGFVELSKAGTMVTNATFEPFTVYGLVALIYFALCWPLSKSSQILERKLNVAHRNH